MDRIEALGAFVSVAELQSFSKAAREHHISPPAMTRLIGQLEALLKVTLFHRTTRSVRLTEDGFALLDQARSILQQWRNTENAMMGRHGAPRGELHVTAPVLFGRMHVLPIVTHLLADHPEMSVRMMLIDRNVRIIEEGIDIAVRIGPLTDSSLVCVKIGSVRQCIVASPDYLARCGVPQKPEDITRHDVIQGDHTHSAEQWRFGVKPKKSVTVNPRLRINSLDGVLEAAKAGAGFANLLSYQVMEAISEGTLCTVLDNAAPPPLPISLLFPPNRAQLASVRAFVEAMQAHAKAHDWMLSEVSHSTPSPIPG